MEIILAALYLLFSYGFMLGLSIFIFAISMAQNGEVTISKQILLVVMFILSPISFPIFLGLLFLIVMLVK